MFFFFFLYIYLRVSLDFVLYSIQYKYLQRKHRLKYRSNMFLLYHILRVADSKASVYSNKIVKNFINNKNNILVLYDYCRLKCLSNILYLKIFYWNIKLIKKIEVQYLMIFNTTRRCSKSKQEKISFWWLFYILLLTYCSNIIKVGESYKGTC